MFTEAQQQDIISACRNCPHLVCRSYGVKVKNLEGFSLFEQIDQGVDALGAYAIANGVEVRRRNKANPSMSHVLSRHFGVKEHDIVMFNKGFDGWDGEGEFYEFGKSLRRFL